MACAHTLFYPDRKLIGKTMICTVHRFEIRLLIWWKMIYTQPTHSLKLKMKFSWNTEERSAKKLLAIIKSYLYNWWKSNPCRIHPPIFNYSKTCIRPPLGQIHFDLYMQVVWNFQVHFIRNKHSAFGKYVVLWFSIQTSGPSREVGPRWPRGSGWWFRWFFIQWSNNKSFTVPWRLFLRSNRK